MHKKIRFFTKNKIGMTILDWVDRNIIYNSKVFF